MFCHNCGKEIQEGAKFCSYCGQSQKLSESRLKTDTAHSDKAITENINTNQDSTVSEHEAKAKETMKENAGTVVASAKSTGENVNEATSGKAQTDADMDKRTAQDLANEVQQVTEDNDTGNFLKKNNNRNYKIIAGLIAIICLFIIFVGSPKYHNEAINEAEHAVSLMKDSPSIDSSKVLFEADRGNLKTILVSVNITTKKKEKFTLYYSVLIDTKEGKKQAIVQGAAKTDDEKEVQIKRIKNHLINMGFTIK